MNRSPKSLRESRRQPPFGPSAVTDEVYLWDVFLIIFHGWRIIAATCILTILLAAGVTLITPAKYRAHVVVASTLDEQQGKSALQEIAAEATSQGKISGGSAPSRFEKFQFLITSLGVARRLQKDHSFLQKLYPTQWNAVEGKWEHKVGRLGALKIEVKELFGLPGWTPPSPEDLAAFLHGQLVDTAIARGIVEYSIVYQRQQLALALLADAVQETDDLIRQTDIAETGQEISYLEGELNKVTLDEHRRALTGLLVTAEQKMMFLRSGAPVSIQILEGPAVSTLPVSPNLFLNLSLGCAGGIMLGLALVFLTNAWRYRRHTAFSNWQQDRGEREAL